MSLRVPPRWVFAAPASAFLAAISLAGCVESTSEIAPGVDSAQFVRREDANMAGATMAIISIEGAPQELSGQFRQSLDKAAAERQIAVAPPASAQYLIRGYLNASPVENGARVDFVWDVFTPDKRRVQRLTDAMLVQGAGDDAWAMVNDAALNGIAAKCADDLAAYLSNTPEAAPAAALSYAQ